MPVDSPAAPADVARDLENHTDEDNVNGVANTVTCNPSEPQSAGADGREPNPSAAAGDGEEEAELQAIRREVARPDAIGRAMNDPDSPLRH
jgi:hypothetical protein